MTAAPATAYKVLTGEEMAALARDGRFEGSAADRADGYIHLSTAAQLAGTIERHFAGRADLYLVTVDIAACGAALRWEPSRGGDLFPHLYAPLSLAAVIAHGRLDRARVTASATMS